jgi:hypothetical protein
MGGSFWDARICEIASLWDSGGILSGWFLNGHAVPSQGSRDQHGILGAGIAQVSPVGFRPISPIPRPDPRLGIAPAIGWHLGQWSINFAGPHCPHLDIVASQPELCNLFRVVHQAFFVLNVVRMTLGAPGVMVISAVSVAKYTAVPVVLPITEVAPPKNSTCR